MTTESTKREGMGWPVRIVLIVSLGLNLLVAGLLVGFAVMGKDRHMAPPPRDAAAPYTRSLEPSQQRALMRDMRRDYDGKRFRLGDLAGEYRQAVTLLKAEPFDAAAYEALLLRQASQAQERLEAGQKALARQVAEMDPKARAAYAKRLEAELNRLGERKKEWRPNR